ncbi:hypothetical protein D3C81_1472840 [compost metagenome]
MLATQLHDAAQGVGDLEVVDFSAVQIAGIVAQRGADIETRVATGHFQQGFDGAFGEQAEIAEYQGVIGRNGVITNVSCDAVNAGVTQRRCQLGIGSTERILLAQAAVG